MVAQELQESKSVSAGTVQEQPTKTSTTTQNSVFVYEPPQWFSEKSIVPKWLQSWIVDIFNWVVIHYNLYPLPVLVLFYYLYQIGYGMIVVACVALYLPSFLNGDQRTGKGREWRAFRKMGLWRMSANYLRMKIIREQELDGNKKYVFGYHPHGIIVLSRIVGFGGIWEKVFPDVSLRLLGASTLFFVPLCREICLWLGAVDASRSTADNVLNAGISVVVYPGGVPEIFLVDPKSKENVLVLKKRLGFVKLAMRHGAELVPTFVFGEKWLYNVWNPPKNVIAFFRKTLQIPMILFWGKFMWIPKQLSEEKRYGVVYGKPIPTKLTAEPTEEEIRAVHAVYVAEVERLFNQYKKDFGYDDDETLVIT